MATIDLVIIAAYVVFALGIGSLFLRRASEGMQSFFVGDRKLPWWIAGTSIVATTFAADTPLAVAGIVANDGISGNWIWWCWALAHVCATFFFARLWRRSGVITDAEVTELRYSGRPAAALRGFKAFYFGIFINCLVMAWVISAMVKISGAFFPEIPAWQVIAACIVVSVVYTTLGGFRGVVITDLVQFAMGMIGAIALAVYALDLFGGMGSVPQGGAPPTDPPDGLLGHLAKAASEGGTELSAVLDFVPGADHPTITPIYFVVLLFAGWWRYAEGNGYIVQRLAASKNERHAQAASLWFAVAHNALRPWPWIIVGLAGLVAFPDLVDKEMAYPLMMKKVLPAGLLGLVIASLLAAFMSTIDTHTNWGASYMVNDVYRRFIRPDADERHYALVSRVCIVLIAIVAGISATFIGNIAAVWRFLIALGAGLGSVSAARWYWGRVTPHAEFAALGVTTVLAVTLELFFTEKLFGLDNALFVTAVPAWVKILVIAAASLATWIPVALFGPKNDAKTLQAFYEKVRPAGPGWRREAAAAGASPDRPWRSLAGFCAGVAITFLTLFGIGELLIGSTWIGLVQLAGAGALLAWIVNSGEEPMLEPPDPEPEAPWPATSKDGSSIASPTSTSSSESRTDPTSNS